MSKETIQDLLGKLQTELQTAELDDETRSLMATLDAKIQARLAAPTNIQGNETLPEIVQQLEAIFAARHPTAERFLREMIDALAKMGI